MSIQVYECKDHGRVDVLIRSLDVPSTLECSVCGVPMPNVISAPAIVDVRRTWNDKANDCRCDPYTQAKEQFKNLSNENQLHYDDKPLKITEAGLQVAAREIDKRNRGIRPIPVQQKQHQQLSRKQKKAQQAPES